MFKMAVFAFLVLQFGVLTSALGIGREFEELPLFASAYNISDSFVAIEAEVMHPNFTSPWSSSADNLTASGLVLHRKRLLIPGRLAFFHTRILVRPYKSSTRYNARVLSIANEAELAVATVDDPEFWELVSPMELSDRLPELGETVYFARNAFNSLKATVTGVEMRRSYDPVYGRLLPEFLTLETDTSHDGFLVNEEGQCCGTNGNHLTLSSQVVKKYLQNLDNYGKYIIQPDLSIWTQSAENPTMKAHYGLTRSALGSTKFSPSGLRIRKLAPTWVPVANPAGERKTVSSGLAKDDIILGINGHDIGDDGKVLYGATRLSYPVIFAESNPGDKVTVTVLRNKKVEDILVPLGFPKFVIDLEIVNLEQPRYFFYGGVVFAPITWNLLSPRNEFKYPSHIRKYIKYPQRQEGSEEYVVVIQIIRSELLIGYDIEAFTIVETINDQSVENLKHLVELIESPGIVKGPNKDEFVKIGLALGQQIVLEKSEAARVTQQLMARENIMKDRVLNGTRPF